MQNSTDASEEDIYRASAITYFILFTVIVLLNGLVIFVVSKKENRQSRLNVFILHLAIADLLIGFIGALGDGIYSHMLTSYYGGDILCRLWRYMKFVTTITSNDLLIGLSIDRFLAVAYPMLAMRLGSKINRILVLVAWLLGLIVPVFILPYSEGVNGEEKEGYCNITLGKKKWWKIYAVIMSLALYVLPTIIITLCYAGICVVIWRRWKQSHNLSEIQKSSSDGSSRKYEETTQTSSGMLSKARGKSMKMALVICLVFFLCWTPYFVFTLLQVFEKGVGPYAYAVIGALYCLNSVCNPLVFILFNKDKFLPSNMCQIPSQTDGPSTFMTSD